VVSDESGPKYIDTRKASQAKCITTINKLAKQLNNLLVTEVPYVDTEVMGIYGLRYFASLAHKPESGKATNPITSKKLTIFGGKGNR
jgi:hypothetical protein